jgi:hypothetical protein
MGKKKIANFEEVLVDMVALTNWADIVKTIANADKTAAHFD